MDKKINALLENRFFSECTDPTNSFDIKPLLREWFTVSKVFALSLTNYIALLANEIDQSTGENIELLENALLYPLSISYGEFRAERFHTGEIHYKMLARMANCFGVSTYELMKNPYGFYSETVALNLQIKRSFRDIAAGAGCLYVVEAIGYVVVNSLNHLVTKISENSCNKKLTSVDYEYIPLHLILELKHPSLIDNFFKSLSFDPKYTNGTDKSVDVFIQLFQNFWNKMHLVTFRQR